MKLQSCWFLFPYHVWCWSNYFHFHFFSHFLSAATCFFWFFSSILRASFFTHDENFPKRFTLQRKNRFLFSVCRKLSMENDPVFIALESKKNLELDGLWSVDLFLSAVDFLNSFSCGGKKSEEAKFECFFCDAVNWIIRRTSEEN